MNRVNKCQPTGVNTLITSRRRKVAGGAYRVFEQTGKPAGKLEKDKDLGAAELGKKTGAGWTKSLADRLGAWQGTGQVRQGYVLEPVADDNCKEQRDWGKIKMGKGETGTDWEKEAASFVRNRARLPHNLG